MKKKGFTLIELLAVIVILGIITVIAVPKILDIINKSRESAASSSIKLVKDAIKTQIASSELTNSIFIKETDGCYIFNFDDQTTGNAKVLEIKNKDKVSGSIKYCNNTFNYDTLKFNGNGIGKNEPKGKIICKRASILHTEECTQTDSQYYCSGVGYTTSGTKGTSTITYGNLGTNGMLTSGDAFDCDVNGDGKYNSETERFYYVSDYYNTTTKKFESDTALLVYYNSVSFGNPSNGTTYVYDNSGENFHGPRTAFTHLPTTSKWSNVSLKNTSRAILNENDENTTTGGTTPSNFSYSEYAARLLTMQEVMKAIGSNNTSINQKGILDNYAYMLENTKFSNENNGAWAYWLETPCKDYSNSVWGIHAASRTIGVYETVLNYKSYSIRPAIEVSKTNIEY